MNESNEKKKHFLKGTWENYFMSDKDKKIYWNLVKVS